MKVCVLPLILRFCFSAEEGVIFRVWALNRVSDFVCFILKHQASVVQKLDSVIHRINLYPTDKC